MIFRTLLLLTLCCVLPAQASRLALVIGNADYAGGKLKNPVADARAMDAKLASLGFAVQRVENLRRDQIGRTVSGFVARIKAGDEVIVFYAGHGVQVKGINYLPAVDADIQSEDDVPLYSVNLNALMERLDESKASVKLLFLDACRNNSYASRVRGGERGLARVSSAPSGTLINFASRPGSVAADGDGVNGLYTSRLLRHLDTPGISVEEILKRVAADVESASNGKQEPWSEGSIRGEFIFKRGIAPPVASTAVAVEPDRDEQARLMQKLAALVTAQKKFYAGQRLPTTASGIPLLHYTTAKTLKEQASATQLKALYEAYRRDAERGDPVAQVSLANMHFEGAVVNDAQEGREWLRKAAQAGQPLAQGELGLIYWRGGKDWPSDKAEALAWYRKGAEQQDAEAQFHLAEASLDAANKDRDVPAALRWYRLAAEQGLSAAELKLGAIYLDGAVVPKDPVEGLAWVRKAADKGMRQAQSALGQIYLTGYGVPKDEALGAQWVRKAAEQGSATDQMQLGVLYVQGTGVPKNVAEGISWYRKSADQGYFMAQYNLGVLYHFGQDVPADLAEAVKWYRKAAEKGFGGAMINLGTMYLNGQGVAKDEAEAARLFLKPAEAGAAVAQANLAGLYKDGRGVPKDLVVAAKWYRKAADQGAADAQYMLGLFYRLGWGVEKNEDEARKWIRKATDQGHPP